MKLFTPFALLATLLLNGPVARAQRPAPATTKPTGAYAKQATAPTKTKTAAAHRLPTIAELRTDYLDYQSIAIRIADKGEYDAAVAQYKTEILIAPVPGDNSYSFAMDEIELLVVWVPRTIKLRTNCIIGYHDWPSVRNIDTLKVYYPGYIKKHHFNNEESPGNSLGGGRDSSKNTSRALFKLPSLYIKRDKGFIELQPFKAAYLREYSREYEGVIINPPVP